MQLVSASCCLVEYLLFGRLLPLLAGLVSLLVGVVDAATGYPGPGAAKLVGAASCLYTAAAGPERAARRGLLGLCAALAAYPG